MFAATPFEVKDRLLGRFEAEVRDGRHDSVDVFAAEGRVWLVGESTSNKRIDAYLKLAEATASGFEVSNYVTKVDGWEWDTYPSQADLVRDRTGELEACEAWAPSAEPSCLWPTEVSYEGLRGYALSPQGRRAIEAHSENRYSRGVEVGLPWHWMGDGEAKISGLAPHLVAPAVRLRVRKATVRVSVSDGAGGRPEVRLEGTASDRSQAARCRREGPIVGTVFVDCSAVEDATVAVELDVSTGLSIEAEEVRLHLEGAPAYLGLKAVRADFFAEVPEGGAGFQIESLAKPESIETPRGFRGDRSYGTRSYEWSMMNRARYGRLFGRVFLRTVEMGTLRIEEGEPDPSFPARSHWQAFAQHRVGRKRDLAELQMVVRTRGGASAAARLEEGELAVEIDGRRAQSVVVDRVTAPPELLVVVDGTMADRAYELAARALEELDGAPVITAALMSGGQLVVMTRRTDKRVAAEAIRHAPAERGLSLIREAAALGVDLADAVALPDHWRLVLVTDLVADGNESPGRIGGGRVRRLLAEAPDSPVVLEAAPFWSRGRDRQLVPALRAAGAVFRELSDVGALREELRGERYLVTVVPPEGRGGLLRVEVVAGAGLGYRREVWVR